MRDKLMLHAVATAQGRSEELIAPCMGTRDVGVVFETLMDLLDVPAIGDVTLLVTFFTKR